MSEAPFLKRRTFAIISHPDAGKTTLTEKLLLYAGALTTAGAVRDRKVAKQAASDWMALEQQRGISVGTSGFQILHRAHVLNLLDTPGHADFSEDTYRTLTAVDTAVMVLDAGKGVEARTIKLMDVCRLRDTPIIAWVNKMDRGSLEPWDVIDDIQKTLGVEAVPVTWPLGSGSQFQGVYWLGRDCFTCFRRGDRTRKQAFETVQGRARIQSACDGVDRHTWDRFWEAIELLEGALVSDRAAFLQGRQVPVYFGSALHNFGIETLLDALVERAPAPQPRAALSRVVRPEEPRFSGFVFKIQANMDPKHRDRMAFVRVCSGVFHQGMKVYHVRRARHMAWDRAMVCMASERVRLQTAYPGDILGVHSHGHIQLGDTFTEGEALQFTGFPYFAPELFRRVRLRDPMKSKALHKGLDQLSEEGATQVFRPLIGADVIVGAVGVLQFDVVAFRLQSEYHVDCIYEAVPIQCARWVYPQDDTGRAQWPAFEAQHQRHLARDRHGMWTYLAPSQVNLLLTQERWPHLVFADTREHQVNMEQSA